MSQLRELREAVGSLEKMLREDPATEALLRSVHPAYRTSARNFVHYVRIRQIDLRQLQLGLFRLGLSSLGRLEGHVLDALTNVRERLDDTIARHGASGPSTSHALDPLAKESEPATWDDAERLLHEHTRALLGPRPAQRHVYVMVTAPSAREVDAAWVERLLAAGMNLLRVNTAHEDERAWTHIVELARSVAIEKKAHLRFLVDLPGPKLRTVMLEEGARVAKWKPTRDELGRVIAPFLVTLRPSTRADLAEASVVVVPEGPWGALEPGDVLDFRDARGKHRTLTITRREDDHATAELRDTAYVVPGMPMTLRRDDRVIAELQLGDLPPRPSRVTLATGERFRLVTTGAGPTTDMPSIGCTLEAALASLRPGQRVLFDDGHLEAVAEEVAPDQAVLRVTCAPAGTFRLGGEKGINLPDTELTLPLFAEDDERALAFAVRHADIVGASFVRGPEDVRELHRRLAALDADRVGVVLKIETSQAFGRLPAILLAALERAPVGVMIARGDLAIESGYERLAELQEEILWLCEAAHVPVIWATQVLDILARTGRPSRAEVTDAAMSVRAECVMLNKGPYVDAAAGALDDILRRMEQHQYKKRSLYRRLHLDLPEPT